MKHGIIFWLTLAASFMHAAEPQPLELRQVVIRAPEMDVLTWAADPAVTDAQLSERLWQAVREGRARVVSDVAGAIDDTRRATLSTGHRVWLPSELDQDFDRLFMTPTAYQEFSVGTSVDCKAEVTADAKFATRIRTDWATRFSPREPLAVQWPSSWLNIYDHQAQKSTDKLLHGWLDWHDLFEESVLDSVMFHPGAPKVLGMLPPADQVWPDGEGERGRWLDVFMGHMGRPGMEAPPPLSPRTLLLGIAMPSGAALELMAARKPADDAALLTSLLAKVRAGGARMIFSAGSSNDPLRGNRATLTSARMHAYPTEMPSIPSAWDERPVGTYWETDANVVALRQDLAPPGRTEWRLAQDVPAAIMWEPRFRFLDIQATHGLGSGTYLLSLLQIPEVMGGPGLEANQTIFIFAKHHAPPRKPSEGLVSKDPFTPGGDTLPPPLEYEAEMMVFEVPAKEAAEWQPAPFATAQESDQTRLQALLGRVHDGTATLAAHLLLRRPQGYRSRCCIVEEYMTATEFDPPEHPGSPRMRPTALETLPVGTRWEIDLSDPAPDDDIIALDHTFEHSTAKPVEPPLAETLVIAAGEKEDYPGAVHHQEIWKGTVTARLDQPLCLGTQNPPGDDREVRHVAFLRVRKLPAATP